jgi:hypothetical protein
MLSFTDSMTNLLTFFILLLTFSAFGDFGTGVNAGMGPAQAGHTLDVSSGKDRNDVLPRTYDPELPKDHGSEKPTRNPNEDMERPRAPIGILDAEVHHDRKVIRIPSRLVYYGWGSYLTDRGKQRLAELARLMREQPGRVIIAESSHKHPNHPLFARPGLATARAWSAVEYFVNEAGLPADAFCLAAEVTVASGPSAEEPVVEITMLARRIYP